MTIQEYVAEHTQRGECQCGKCVDKGDRPDPAGHAVDMVFFKVAAKGDPTAEQFNRLTSETRGEFAELDPLDGKDRNYVEIGGWIGGQGLALRYMALGVILGVFKLLSPKTVLGEMSVESQKQLAGAGFLSVQKA